MITPLDIKKHEFATRFRGVDPDEVRALLETIAKDFEELTRQNTQLSERIKIAEERLNHYRLIEKTLQDAVITIQNTLEEKKKVAQEQYGEFARSHGAHIMELYTERALWPKISMMPEGPSV